MKKKQPKPQRRGNTLQVNVPVNFNLADQEEKLDLDFLDSKGKRSTKIKEWIRAWRLGTIPDVSEWVLLNRCKPMFIPDISDVEFEEKEMHVNNEDEALQSVF